MTFNLIEAFRGFLPSMNLNAEQIDNSTFRMYFQRDKTKQG